ncbi:adrenomedullin a [Denticeps clupeoides]|uniref:Pro-adrenomedullin n=1 Tax=Denticeps clupeoides TaxID=299321 RepID=A0AAY4C6S8_9TELE|nr:ADM [Denticeps clupeoides]
MKTFHLSLLCCCALVVIVPGVDGAALLPTPMARNSGRLQSKARRHMASLPLLRDLESGLFIRPEDVRDRLVPYLSTDIKVRTKRSKRSGCSLGTCTVHDLPHRINQFSNKLKITQAPLDKMSAQGYGRRRRRSVPLWRLRLRKEGQRIRPVWNRTDARLRQT